MTDRKSRKKQITEQRQEQILKAAGDVFTSKGYNATTIPEIAKQARVAVGTIYNYYPAKRELFIAVIKNLIITVPLLDLMDKLPGTDIIISFKQIMRNRFSLIDTEPVSRIPSLMGEIIRDPELKAIWAEQFIRPFFDRMEELYRTMVASGRFRRMNSAVAVRALGGFILGFLMLKIMEGETSPLNSLSKEEVVDALTNFVLYGLAENVKKRKERKTSRD
jgi:AcrR family transcriptional regulator